MKNKNLIFVLIAICMPILMHAQDFTRRGNFLMGTGLAYSSNNSRVAVASTNATNEGDGPTSIQWSVSPHIGYFLVRNFTLGIGLDYTFSREKQPNQDKTEDSDLLFGPFGRLYLPFGGDKAFFLESNFGFGNSSDDQVLDGVPQKITNSVIAFGAGPGFTIFSNDAVGIETLFKYNYARSRFNTEVAGVSRQTTTKTNQFAVSLGLQFYFGGIRRAG